jgi:hypothetical protein
MLIATLERGPGDLRFECASIEVLGMARCRSARGSITARLQSPHLELRVAAARALGRLGMGEAIPVLVMALADPAWPVRAMAAQALGRLSASPAVDALAACVSDRAWWVRHHAAYALAAIGGEGRDALCNLAARSEDGYAREMAREALDFGERREQASPPCSRRGHWPTIPPWRIPLHAIRVGAPGNGGSGPRSTCARVRSGSRGAVSSSA